MVFKNRKIPKHLIIEEEYDIRRKSRFGFFKMLVVLVVVICLTWIISIAVVQI